jgi:hemoglobin
MTSIPSGNPHPDSPATLPQAAAPAGSEGLQLGLRAKGRAARETGTSASDTVPDAGDPASVYAAVGGEETFARIAAAFYRGVAADPVLHPMYPEEDLGPAEERLKLFLIQYWGGPTTYSELRGHPRLRMRHIPYKVDADARDRWLKCMFAALDEVAVPPLYDGMMRDYFERAATAMINSAG